MVRSLFALVVVIGFAGFAFSQGKSADSAAADVKSFEGLWSGSWGGAAPDSDAALKTIARLVKPGTFVFVLSPGENAPEP